MYCPSRQHEMKTVLVEVYIQQWFHEEQGAAITKILKVLVWSEMTLGMKLSASGWLYWREQNI